MRIDPVSIGDQKISGVAEKIEKAGVSESAVAGKMWEFPEDDPKIYDAIGNEDMERRLFFDYGQDEKTNLNQLTKDQMEQLMEKGFSMTEDSPQVMVTVVDKIRLEMAKGGQDLEKTGGEFSREQLSQMLGNPNLEPAIEATIKQAESLKTPDSSTVNYLMSNSLSPTVSNVYLAQYAGSQKTQEGASLEEASDLLDSMKEVITKAGYEPDNENLEKAAWMLANKLPLTVESYQQCQQLFAMQCPPDKPKLLAAIYETVEQGKQPKDTLLVQEPQDKVSQLLNQVQKAVNLEGKTPKEIGKQRELEETRLLMTKEAVGRLSAKGIEISTNQLEQLVEELRQLENEANQSYLAAEGETDLTSGQVDTFCKTEYTLGMIPLLPAVTLGAITENYTLTQVFEEGLDQQSRLVKAGVAYETMMTLPRGDLGDSLEKAFQQTDSLLEEMGLPITEDNQKAVRILAYQQTEISQEKIQQVKTLSLQVETLVDKMTPRVVLSMIKEQYQPLDVPISELTEKATEIAEEIEDQTGESFSRFLWKLDQTGDITQEERSSYLGIYRLLHQVQRRDSSAILGLVKTGQKMTLKNLLTQVRTMNRGSLDLSVEETAGELSSEGTEGDDITKQVQAAYEKLQLERLETELSPAVLKGIAKTEPNYLDLTPEQLHQLSEEWKTSDEVKEETKEYESARQKTAEEMGKTYQVLAKELAAEGLPQTPLYATAMWNLMKHRNQQNRFLSEQMDEDPDIAEIKEGILKKLGESLEAPEDMAEAQKELAETAEHVMKTMTHHDQITGEELQELRILQAQMKIQTAWGKRELYEIPVLVTDEMANVTLKIVRGTEEKGKVALLFETQSLGKVAAELSSSQGTVGGYIASDRKDTLDLLQKNFKDYQANYLLITDLSLERLHTGMIRNREGEGERDKETTADLYQMAREVLKRLTSIQVKESEGGTDKDSIASE